jgi:hypothetical protein
MNPPITALLGERRTDAGLEGMLPGGPYALGHLSDTDLLTGTRGLVARSNHHLAALLAHLAEVETRGIHRLRACSSLYTYCLYELRLSEDAAYRHARAAKVARQFPILFEKIAAGEIHLSGVLLLGPHLTEDNHRRVLERAKHRSKREIAKLVRMLDPLPDVPPRIEPLGPSPCGLPVTGGTWQDFVASLNPVRELEAGQRPRDWVDLPIAAEAAEEAGAHDANDADAGTPPRESTSSFVPQRYRVQFTANQEYVDLVQRAGDLLPHPAPGRSLAEVHLRAMRLLVSELEKRKYGTVSAHSPLSAGKARRENRGTRVERKSASETSRRRREIPTELDPAVLRRKTDHEHDLPLLEENDPEANGDKQHGPKPVHDSLGTHRKARRIETSTPEDPRQRGRYIPVIDRSTPEDPHRKARRIQTSTPEDPRQRGRYIPVAVRRRIRERDGQRCAYVDHQGQRCRETSCLEIHHVVPHALGGPSTTENLGLRCRSHNALAAEQDFGRDHMARKSGRDDRMPDKTDHD